MDKEELNKLINELEDLQIQQEDIIKKIRRASTEEGTTPDRSALLQETEKCTRNLCALTEAYETPAKKVTITSVQEAMEILIPSFKLMASATKDITSIRKQRASNRAMALENEAKELEIDGVEVKMQAAMMTSCALMINKFQNWSNLENAGETQQFGSPVREAANGRSPGKPVALGSTLFPSDGNNSD